MMGMCRGMCGGGGADAMTMLSVMVIIASYYPRRLVVRDDGEGWGWGWFLGGDSLRAWVGHLEPLDFLERVP